MWSIFTNHNHSDHNNNVGQWSLHATLKTNTIYSIYVMLKWAKTKIDGCSKTVPVHAWPKPFTFQRESSEGTSY